MWAVWTSRNKRKHGDQVLPVQITVQWAIDTAFDLWQIIHPEKNEVPTRRAPAWQRPPPGWVKCNVDAAFFGGIGAAATGMILRDAEGRSGGGKAIWHEHCLSPLAAEALACCDGMSLAAERGIRQLQMETDCQVLVNLWFQRTSQKSEVDAYLRQMESLSRSFDDFNLCFISRACNKIAHECARRVSQDHQVEEWLITPPGLRDMLNEDCNLLPVNI